MMLLLSVEVGLRLAVEASVKTVSSVMRLSPPLSWRSEEIIIKVGGEQPQSVLLDIYIK